MAKRKKSQELDLSRKKKKVFDIDTNIKVALKTGEVVRGKNLVLRNLRTNPFKMIIVANNCPYELMSELKHYNSLSDSEIYIHKYKGSSWDLGLACGEPYMISILGIYNYGDSDLESLKNKGN
ncbi:MAG: 50S ribosomal protein L30e [Promethearchaeota archaeon]|jgi:large subunit ribosomal protein L30e|nr:MAG: 50S ribosomal protein L30e [Candidatus Lokiarchaeota archaeon]